MDPLSVAASLVGLLEVSNTLTKILSKNPTEGTKLVELKPALKRLITMLEDVRRIILMNPNIVTAQTYLQFNDTCSSLSTTMQDMMDLVNHIFKSPTTSSSQQLIKQKFLKPRIATYVDRTARSLELLQNVLMVIM